MKWTFDLLAAGVLAGGIDSLDALRRVARGQVPADEPAGAAPPPPLRLAGGERRRASMVVRQVMACVEQVLGQPPVAVDRLRCIFATDEGTGETCQQMLEAVCTTGQVSPMVFTNSVQNAPSGYCAIGYGNRNPATVISQGLESFASALLCCLADLHETPMPVLLVTYDAVMPAPLSELHPVTEACASACLLAPAGLVPGALARFTLGQLPCDGRAAGPWPAWLPARWAGLASLPSLAALGLIDGLRADALHLPLNGITLVLRRAEEGRP